MTRAYISVKKPDQGVDSPQVGRTDARLYVKLGVMIWFRAWTLTEFWAIPELQCHSGLGCSRETLVLALCSSGMFSPQMTPRLVLLLPSDSCSKSPETSDPPSKNSTTCPQHVLPSLSCFSLHIAHDVMYVCMGGHTHTHTIYQLCIGVIDIQWALHIWSVEFGAFWHTHAAMEPSPPSREWTHLFS